MQKIVFTGLLYFVLSFGGFAQISVRTVDSLRNPMVDSLVRTLAGYGVSIFNVKSNLRQTNKSLGTFRSNHPLFPFSSGLVMSTGLIDSIPKRNRATPLSTKISYSDTTGNCPEGRWLLQKILSRQSNNGLVQKATELSTIRFNLVPVGDSLKFRYIFGSDEYPEFVCSQFNDIFGFFIKGPGIEGDSVFTGTPLEGFHNLARLPQSGKPVAINSVNSGQSGPTGSAGNCSFSSEGIAQYRPNDSYGTPLYNSLAFDGLTQVLTAKASVVPCAVYTFVLVVSDVGDRIYDSGVFLERGSMVSGKFDATVTNANPSLGDTLTGCHPAKLKYTRCPNVQDRWVIRFIKEGSALGNLDYKQRLPDGTLTSVPDSIVLLPGQSSDSLVLEGLGSGLNSKEILIRYLDLNQPFLNGQPNFSGSQTRLVVRPRANQPEKNLSGCWNDTTHMAFRGSMLSQLSYKWMELTEGQTIESALLSCSDCRTPTVHLDTTDRTFLLSTTNLQNACNRKDTLQVRAKRFIRPVFLTDGAQVSIQDRQQGYLYRWKLNGVSIGTDSSGHIDCQPGDQVALDVFSPNGCRATYRNDEIFTEAAVPDRQDPWALYPNPARDFLILPLRPEETTQFRIYDFSGKTVKTGDAKGNGFIDLKILPNGIYFLKTNNGKPPLRFCVSK